MAPRNPEEPEPVSMKMKHLEAAERAALRRYWRSNIKIMAALLVVWAVVGLGCGVLVADVLNTYSLGGYPLGFWFAQQGSIGVFVLLILVYAIALNRLDTKHHAEIRDLRLKPPPQDAASESTGETP